MMVTGASGEPRTGEPIDVLTVPKLRFISKLIDSVSDNVGYSAVTLNAITKVIIIGIMILDFMFFHYLLTNFILTSLIRIILYK